MGFWSWQDKVEEEINRLPSSRRQELARLRKLSIAQDGKAARDLRVFIREQFCELIDLAVVGQEREIAIAQATEVIYQTVLGHTTRELYRDSKRGDRDTLPAAAQNAIALGEFRACEGLEEATWRGDTWDRIDQVNQICRDAGGKVRRRLPW